jgi:hypothetical protein
VLPLTLLRVDAAGPSSGFSEDSVARQEIERLAMTAVMAAERMLELRPLGGPGADLLPVDALAYPSRGVRDRHTLALKQDRLLGQAKTGRENGEGIQATSGRGKSKRS